MMKVIGMWIAAAVMGVVAVADVYAAEVNVYQFDSGKKYIYLDGAVEEGDLDRLKSAYDKIGEFEENVMLFLNSPGGNGAEMKAISEALRDEDANIRAVVAEDAICYSACAVIWASAPYQSAHVSAEIGFHISSIAILPESIDYLDQIKEGYGWSGVMDLVQASYADDIKYYAEMPVAYPRALALEIAMLGDEFFMIDQDNSWIIGDVFWVSQ